MPKTYEKRSDGRIYYQGSWRTQEQLNKVKEKRKEYDKKQRELKKAERDSYARKYKREHPEYFREHELKRYHAGAKYDRDPAHGLSHAISEYRRGRISLNDLNRQCDASLARADALARKVRKSK